ncbi:MAG: hypothetical protein M1830_007689, partial [Pleopsidium flavum]
MGPNTSSIMKTARTRAAASREPDDPFTSPSRQSSVRSSTYNNNRISPLLPRSTVSPHSRPQPRIVVQDQPVIGTASPTDINPISAHSEPSPPSALGEAVTAVGASPIANNLDPCAAKGITLKLAQIDAEPGEHWLVVRDG